MLWMITTAGSDQAGVCYAMHQFTERILEGLAMTKGFFGHHLHDRPEDNMGHRAAWRKPTQTGKCQCSLMPLRKSGNRAKQIASQQASFKMKHLNLWMNADSTWLNMTKLQGCVDASLMKKVLRVNSASSC